MQHLTVEQFHDTLKNSITTIESLFLYGIGKVSLNDDNGLGYENDFISGKPVYHLTSDVSLVDKNVREISVRIDLTTGKAFVCYLDGPPTNYDIWEYTDQPVTILLTKVDKTSFGPVYSLSLVIGDETEPFERRSKIGGK